MATVATTAIAIAKHQLAEFRKRALVKEVYVYKAQDVTGGWGIYVTLWEGGWHTSYARIASVPNESEANAILAALEVA